ncbi:MAG: DUF3108 domain-containing protein [Tepidiformaceae bacterium]
MRRLLIGAAAAAGLLAGCGGGDDEVISKVFQGPPWTGAESLSYQLVQRGGDVYGTCEVETRPEFEPGRTQLNLLCTDGEGNRDDRTAVVDAQTLRPISGIRTISGEDGDRTTFESAYGERIVRLEANVDGKRNSAERDLPGATAKSPDPGYYDDESLLWVVRGIPLRVGYEGAYKNINAGNGRVFTVEVKVEGQERVRVPAGAFNAWKVRIRTESITQQFWIDEQAPNRIVRARIERLTYELVAVR